MNRPAIIDIISNPFFLALIFILPGIIYFESSTPVYISETIYKEILPDNTMLMFDDLDGDEKVEMIRCKENELGNAAIVIEKDTGIVGQFNLPGSFPNWENNIFIGNANDDEIKEIFACTNMDSIILLNVLDFSDMQNPLLPPVFYRQRSKV